MLLGIFLILLANFLFFLIFCAIKWSVSKLIPKLTKDEEIIAFVEEDGDSIWHA